MICCLPVPHTPFSFSFYIASPLPSVFCCLSVPHAPVSFSFYRASPPPLCILLFVSSSYTLLFSFCRASPPPLYYTCIYTCVCIYICIGVCMYVIHVYVQFNRPYYAVCQFLTQPSLRVDVLLPAAAAKFYSRVGRWAEAAVLKAPPLYYPVCQFLIHPSLLLQTCYCQPLRSSILAWGAGPRLPPPPVLVLHTPFSFSF